MGTTLHTSHRSHVQVQSAQPLAFVSATSFGVEAEVRGMVRPKVPNYAIRRLLVGTAALGVLIQMNGGTGVASGEAIWLP